MSNHPLHTVGSLGLMASGKRTVKNGAHYDRLFPQANFKDTIINPNGTVRYTVEQMEKVVQDYHWQTAEIAKKLKANSLPQTLENIWNFYYQHLQYKLDADGKEQLRTPARAWHDGQILARNPSTASQAGIDCDCFSITIASTLFNLGIAHKFRITKYSSGWQHVYVVVPVPGKPQYNWILDCVLDTFNTEKTYTDKFDYTMSGLGTSLGIPVEILSGIDDASEQHAIISGADFSIEGFKGIDDELNGDEELSGDDVRQILASADDELAAIKRHLKRTRAYIARNPESVVFQGGAKNNIQRLDYVLAHWDSPNRMAALNEAARSEHEVNVMMGFASPDDFDPMDGVDDAGDLSNILEEDEMGNLGEIEGMDGDDDAIDGLGKPKKGQKLMQNVRKAAGNVAKKVNAATTKVATVAKKTANKAAETKVGKKVSAAAKKTVTVTKKVAKKVGTAAKKTVKAVVRYNPVTAAARGGYLLFLQTGLLDVAKALRPGYFANVEEAKKAGVSEGDYNTAVKALTRVKKIFVDTLQGKEANLKQAILKGSAKRGLKGVEGLGAPGVETAITTAAPPIIATGKALNDSGSKVNFVKKIAEFFKNYGKQVKAGVQKIKQKRADKKAAKSNKSSQPNGSNETNEPSGNEFNKIINTTEQAAAASGGGEDGGGGSPSGSAGRSAPQGGGSDGGGSEGGGENSNPPANRGGDSGAGSGGSGSSSTDGFFTKALNFAKENPIKTTVGVLTVATGVYFGISALSTKKKSGLSGTGKKRKKSKSTKRRIVSPNTNYSKRKVKYIKM